METLDTLGYDIQYLIAAELYKSSPSTVIALAQASHTLRQAALPFVYRDVTLTRETRTPWYGKSHRALLDIVRKDESGDIVKYVRNINVKDDLPEEDLMLVLNTCAKRGTLKRLSWNIAAHMPDSVYDILHATWPDLELSVSALDRQALTIAVQRKMDTKLLSSPLLKSLTCNVFYQGYSSSEPAQCEWPKLTQAITAGGNLRILNIQVERINNIDQRIPVLDSYFEPKTLARLNIIPGTRLPRLEELRISELWGWGSSTHVWDLEYCRKLREAMDWSRLRKLDFGADRPDQFFVAFTGRLSELKSLRFGVRDGYVGAAVVFMDSIAALEALEIVEARKQIDALWHSIHKHKDSLQVLILRPPTGNDDSIRHVEMSRLTTISEEFSSLERLGWPVPCTKNVEPNWLKRLSTMNLRKLDLFLHLPQEACDYSAHLKQNVYGIIPAPPIDKVGSKHAAVEIMETISSGQERWLESLTLHFARTGYRDRAEPYQMWGSMQVRRRKDDNVGSDQDEAYELRGRQAWGGYFIDLCDEVSS